MLRFLCIVSFVFLVCSTLWAVPTAADKSYETARQFITLHKEDEAVTELSHFLDAFPTDARYAQAAFLLGNCYQTLQKSDKALEACVRENAGSGAGFHIHVAEGVQDLEDARKNYGCGVVERLLKQKILGDKTIAAHCIHISEQEIDLLKETGTIVVHNPESNMGNAVGVSPVLKMFEKGIALSRTFNTLLDEAEKKVNILIKKEDTCEKQDFTTPEGA
jgi:cytosine/adenosine deaminase-related metal-dependent hydrolase